MQDALQLQPKSTTQLLNFVAHLVPVGSGGGAKAAMSYAQDRGWVAPCGDLTADGRGLLASLHDQADTRSVFRF